MLITNIPTKHFETILGLETQLFGAEALNRYGLIQQLRIHSDSSLMAVDEEHRVIGYALGLVKSNGEAWITALAVMPQAMSRNHAALHLAETLSSRLTSLGATVGFTTTRRRSIISLSKRFNGRVVDTVDDYFLDGQPRYVIEFRVRPNATALS